MKLFKALKQIFFKRKLGASYNISVRQMKTGSAKGADIWGTDWPVPVAEKLEWQFYVTGYDRKQYLVTKLTDYIFWFIPFSYDMYIYEVPADTYDINTITHKDVVEAIALCEKWNWHTDKMYVDDSYNVFAILYNNDRTFLPIGDNDYLFVRTK